MTRPKFFRDPLHLQIRFEAVELTDKPDGLAGDKLISWSLQKIIDSEPFQRLRHVRQNGLANLVFHGAEHSRFSHSMGVSHLARVMYEKLCRNSSIEKDFDKEILVSIASLVHDVGHGPFSHTMEEILKENGIAFHHEDMTNRFILEDESHIYRTIYNIDSSLPKKVSAFFDKKLREGDSWIYKIVSSQMDADRLDYVQRDALFAGIKGHGFDIERLFDLIFISKDINIAVDRGAIEAVEAYLVTIDQLWRAVYYHQAVRAATRMLSSLFARAYTLLHSGDGNIFPSIMGVVHPLDRLFKEGKKIPLPVYLRLTDAMVWASVDAWRTHKDPILSDISRRLFARDLFKTIPLDTQDIEGCHNLIAKAKELTVQHLSGVDDAERHYVLLDSPDRTSYRFYDWKPDYPGESIWLTGGGKDEMPIEADNESTIIQGLKDRRKFDRLIVLDEIRKQLGKG